MSVTIEISVTEDTVTAKLASLDGFFSEPGAKLLEAAYAVKEFVQVYHEEFGTRWRGSHYMSGPVSGRWETEVAADWQPPFMVDGNTASVLNTNPTLVHKILGGTIVPVSASMLTIPLVPEAKGIRAAEYEEFVGEKLFRAKNVLATKGSGNDIVPIYALVSSVDQGPWPGAMPPQEELQTIFDKAFEIELDTVLAGV
jgi:hypothetical protein